jgi:hypothetical protein
MTNAEKQALAEYIARQLENLKTCPLLGFTEKGA